MLATVKQLIANQFEAALCTLHACIDRCPDAVWNARVGNHRFCQAAFHTLFYTDYYLGTSEGTFRQQPFHRDHAQVFRDYEEFEDRPPQWLYDKPWIKSYLEHCRTKASQAIAAETADSLEGPSGFPRRKFSRAESHVYSIRHIQHHAAQLSLRLRLDAQVEIPWVRSGWQEA
jgi:hypothetical protein